MRTRPWPLVLIAAFQILTPIFNILFNAWALKVSPLRVLNWVFQSSPLEIFEFLALMPIAGLAIYRMKKGSYAIFIVALVWSGISNFRHFHAGGSFSLVTLGLVYFFQLVLVTYFLLPPVRKTYFDPTVRWWESKPRYELKLDGMLELKLARSPGTIQNLSEGGAFVSASEKIPVGEFARLEFSILTRPYSVPGKIVHMREVGPSNYCYGIQFSHDQAGLKRFRSLIRALRELGFQDRAPTPLSFRGLTDWVVRLAKTGKGFVPEVQYRSKS